jgi:hypothetical protein
MSHHSGIGSTQGFQNLIAYNDNSALLSIHRAPRTAQGSKTFCPLSAWASFVKILLGCDTFNG